MKKKFKRSDIKLQLEDFIKELDRELIMRRAVYAKQVQQKKLSEFRANKRYLIILEIKELLDQMLACGLRYVEDHGQSMCRNYEP